MAAVLTMGVTERRTGAALRLTLHRFRLVTGAEVALVALLVTFSAALPVSLEEGEEGAWVGGAAAAAAPTLAVVKPLLRAGERLRPKGSPGEYNSW